MERRLEPAEFLVCDDQQPCPYLQGRTARMPLRWPRSKLTGAQFDQRLAAGDRRSGAYLYRTQCPRCRACEPIRIDVRQFEASGRQRRISRRGDRLLRAEIGEPLVDRERVVLFNAHRRARRLAGRDGEIGPDQYAAFLVQSCCDTLEIRYRYAGGLAAVAVCDRGADSLSAVYCYFDPQYARLSPGAYSILKQIELCRQWDFQYLYLGLYIAESQHMSYKAQYLPHQRLIDGRWRWFDNLNSNVGA